MEAGFERAAHDVGVGRSRDEHVDDVGIDPQQVVELGRSECVRALRLPPVEPGLVAIAEPDDDDVVTLEVSGQDELGDLAQADDRESEGAEDRQVSGHGRSLSGRVSSRR